MTSANPLDQIPIIVVLIVTAALMLLGIELGIRLGRYRQQVLDVKSPKDIGLLVGATLTMLAFVLVFQVGTADQHYDNRRGLVVTEANAIGTAFLRAGYLEEPYRSESRAQYRDYVDIRLAAADSEITLEEVEAQSGEIQAALWAQAEELARANPQSEMIELYIVALNQVIDVHTERVVAQLARLPQGSLIWLFVLAFLTMSIIGYHNGMSGEHNLIAFVGMVLVFAAVMTLIIDVDRPQEGLFQVSHKAMADLQAMMASLRQ